MTTLDAGQTSNSEITDAIDEVVASVQDNVVEEHQLIGELTRIRSDHLAGAPLAETLEQLRRPRVFELFDGIVDRVMRSSVRLRRTFVRVLVREGENVSTVAKRFGVSHQRISTILKQSTPEPGPARSTITLHVARDEVAEDGAHASG